MKTKIVKIGNSRGVRIPKSFIDESGLKDDVELEVDNGKIIIKSISKPRKEWDSALKKMAKNKDDILLDASVEINQTSWNEEEWEW